VLHEGKGALLLAYGPVMLHEALTAAELLGDRLQVVSMPWLNTIDADWLAELVDAFEEVFVLEDHAPVGGLGDTLRRVLGGRTLHVFGVEGWPACGTPAETLRFHRLDGASVAQRVSLVVCARTAP
jgi:transketolase